MKGSKAVLLTLATTAGLLLLAVGLWGYYARLAAEHWRKQLSTASDQEAWLLLGQVAELGAPGIPVLVEALGSEREGVAEAAKRVLLEQLNRWQELRTQQRSRILAVLADELAQRVERFGPRARRDAADLAARILYWPLDGNVADRTNLIGSCERVLCAAADRRTPAESMLLAQIQYTAPSHAVVKSEGNGSQPRLGRAEPASSDVRVADLTGLPGGGLPIETFPLPLPLPVGQDQPRVADLRAAEPQRLSAPPASQTPRPIQQPKRLLLAPDSARMSIEPEGGSQVRQRPKSTPVKRSSLAEVRAMVRHASQAGRGSELAEVDALDLMRWLRAEDETLVAKARDELMRRGFPDVELDLARRLFDPDPGVRQQLVHLLPGVSGVDAVPWLLQLCRDEDAEVRLEAITWIVTTGNPTLLDQAEQIARLDSDPRIQSLAERIAQQRRRTQNY